MSAPGSARAGRAGARAGARGVAHATIGRLFYFGEWKVDLLHCEGHEKAARDRGGREDPSAPRRCLLAREREIISAPGSGGAPGAALRWERGADLPAESTAVRERVLPRSVHAVRRLHKKGFGVRGSVGQAPRPGPGADGAPPGVRRTGPGRSTSRCRGKRWWKLPH